MKHNPDIEAKVDKRAIIDFFINKYGHIDLIACGRSMLPTINDGDHIRIYPQEKYKEDDIVAFWNANNKIVVHRIILLKNDSCITKGDNSLDIDGDIPLQNIIGTVIST